MLDPEKYYDILVVYSRPYWLDEPTIPGNFARFIALASPVTVIGEEDRFGRLLYMGADGRTARADEIFRRRVGGEEAREIVEASDF